MPGVVMLAFSFFLPSYPLDHVSRLSKKQSARVVEKSAIDKGCSRKFADYLNSICSNPVQFAFEYLLYSKFFTISRTTAFCLGEKRGQVDMTAKRRKMPK